MGRINSKKTTKRTKLRRSSRLSSIKKRKNYYNKESLMMAVEEYRKNEAFVSFRQIATKWEVPVMTLQNHVRNNNNAAVGRPCRLSPIFELLLVNCILQLSDWGFGICYLQIRSIIRSYLENTDQLGLFPDGLVGRKWFSSLACISGLI
jgi:hypothetical protein